MVPLGDRGTLLTGVEDTVSVLHAKFEHGGAPSLAGPRDSVILPELNYPYLGRLNKKAFKKNLKNNFKKNSLK